MPKRKHPLVKSKRRLIALFLVLAVLLSAFLYWQNNDLTVSAYEYQSENLPAAFDGFRIVQISDLHNHTFGAGQTRLLRQVAALQPDMIVVTGDLIDRRRYDAETALTFMEGAVEIAPVYYVTGNHEAWSGQYASLRASLAAVGAAIADDKAYTITRDGQQMRLLGVSDPAFYYTGVFDDSALAPMRQFLAAQRSEAFTILLAHRPNFLSLYAETGCDLVFSGHAHGGQIRLPFLGGLYVPDQGFLPPYTAGLYTEGDTTMVLSRGLGNSAFPFRIFNRPEIVCVQLSAD